MNTKNDQMNKQKPLRDSGVEFLKIIGIILIVISHVVQTLSSNPRIAEPISVIDATTDLQQMILIILRYSGAVGNTIFFVCSAWYLLDSQKFSLKKWFFMLTEIWVISVAILAIAFFLGSEPIETKLLLKSFFPTTFSNNWYMTCYLLFYPIHGILNSVIRRMDQRQLFRTAAIMAFLYMGINFLRNGYYYSSALTLWLTLYFVIAYFKLYMKHFCDNIKANTILLTICMSMHIGIIVLTNVLGLNFSFMSDKMQHWSSCNNPFIIFAVLAALNIARNVHFKSLFINEVSSLSLLIYIIHENIILRTYYRPLLINDIHAHFGYHHVVLWMLLLVLIIFVTSAAVSYLYKLTLRRLVRKASDLLCDVSAGLWRKAETCVLQKSA